jgi:hypothetical protein
VACKFSLLKQQAGWRSPAALAVGNWGPLLKDIYQLDIMRPWHGRCTSSTSGGGTFWFLQHAQVCAWARGAELDRHNAPADMRSATPTSPRTSAPASAAQRATQSPLASAGKQRYGLRLCMMGSLLLLCYAGSRGGMHGMGPAVYVSGHPIRAGCPTTMRSWPRPFARANTKSSQELLAGGVLSMAWLLNLLLISPAGCVPAGPCPRPCASTCCA